MAKEKQINDKDNFNFFNELGLSYDHIWIAADLHVSYPIDLLQSLDVFHLSEFKESLFRAVEGEPCDKSLKWVILC